MPKESKIQASFNAGQISKSVQGRVDNPRYDAALLKCLNYIPILQGPLIRRPGTIYVTNWANSSQPPTLVPFQFSLTQNYALEFGDKAVRFYTNQGQVVTNTTSFYVAGIYSLPASFGSFQFTAIRSSPAAGIGEILTATSVIAPGSVLQLPVPYNYIDATRVKYAPKQDTLYLTHPNYLPGKITRTGLNTWDYRQLTLQDGPYLPLNSYLSTADSASIGLSVSGSSSGYVGSSQLLVTTYPNFQITSAANNGSSAVTVTAPFNNFVQGQHVTVLGGPSSINNVQSNPITQIPFIFTNSSINQAYWVVGNIQGSSTFDLLGAQLTGAFTGTTIVYPSLFQLVSGSSGQTWNEVQTGSNASGFGSVFGTRNLGVVLNGTRYWGYVGAVLDAAHAIWFPNAQTAPPGAGSSSIWQLGVYCPLIGWPTACTFHQDRLVLAGPPGYPQEIDASMTSLYEVFSASGSNIQVNNNNALQFSLNSQDLNAIKWVKSSNQGLVVGTLSNEWSISPSTQTPALTPTNINATQTSAYGSYDTDSVLSGNAIIYIQRAQKKVRELLYFWQVQTFRSTNVSELAEAITYPSLSKLINQKEPHPTIWAVRGDGALTSMSYKRDDVTLQTEVAWAYHTLGGYGNQGGSAPVVSSICTITSGDTTYDQMWLAVQRYINGTTVGTIEYMTKPFDDTIPQELSYHFDCGAIYNSSIPIAGVSNASSCVVTAPNHGLTNSTVIKISQITGQVLTATDPDGNIISTSVLNEQLFVVASVSTNTFYIQDFLGNFINTNSTTAYVGSGLIIAQVTTISGATWLKNETVSLLIDGGIAPNVVVNSAGVIALPFPGSIVSFGYQYNSDGQLLRSHDGSAQGTSIGSTRRVNRVAFMLHNVGDFSFGPNFTRLVPAEFGLSDVNQAGLPPPLFDGIYRDGIESDYGFDDTICFRQNSGLPGMVQAVVRFLEENDV